MSRPTRSLTIVAACAVIGSLLSLGAATPAGAAPTAATTRYVIRYQPGTDTDAEARAQESRGSSTRATLRHVFNGTISDLTPDEVQRQKRNPRVLAIEPDAPVAAVGVQTGATWGLDRIDQVNLPLSASYTYASTGAGVTAYIIDTGIKAHADFTGRLAPGYTAITDANGTTDCNGHGTHVAGTVGGTTYGVAKSVTLVPVRVLDCNGSGSMSSVIAGLDWVVANHPNGVPAVANMSLGGGAYQLLDDAVQSVISDGVTIAVAAGNSNVDACTTSPARALNALTVGASDSTDTRASFSNFGTCVDLFAPGVSITSTWYTGGTNVLSGTSMASPHVAGVAAVLLSADTSLTPAAVASKIVSTSTQNLVKNAGTGSPNRLLYSDPSGGSSTTPTATVPGEATNLRAAGSSGRLTASWTQGAANGSPITSQKVTLYRNGNVYGTATLSGTATTATFTVPKGKWSFTVTETNDIGTGPVSARSNTVTL